MSTAHLSFAELMAKAKSDALNPKTAIISKTQATEQAKKQDLEAARAKQAAQEERERKARAEKKRKDLEEAEERVQELLKEQERARENAAKAKERAVVESTGSGPKDKAAQQAKSERLAKQERWKRKLFEDDDEEIPTTYAARPSKQAKPLPGKKLALPGRKGSASQTVQGKKLTGKAALMADFNASDMVALNQNKRDRRTVEEIERDMKASRMGLGVGPSTLSRQSSYSSTTSQPDKTQAMPKPAHSIPKASPSSGLAALSFRSDKDQPRKRSPLPDKAVEKRPLEKRPLEKRPLEKRRASPPPKKRRMVESDDELDRRPSSSYAKGRDIPRPVKQKRRLAESEDDDDDPGYQRGSIYALMGRDIRKDALQDSDSDDMEAGVDDLEEEERRAAAFARREEREEEERERKRVAEKQKRLAAAGRR